MFSKLLLSIMPGCRQTALPFLNIIKVGTALTLYCRAICCCLSISTFTILALSPTVFATSFTTGSMDLQGPHQVAKKSTSTGFCDLINSANDSITIIYNYQKRSLRCEVSWLV